MPKELNPKQEQLFFRMVLYNRAKLNFEPSFEEMADLPASTEWGVSVHSGGAYNPKFDISGEHVMTVRSLLDRGFFDTKIEDFKPFRCLNRAGMNYLFETAKRLEEYLKYEERNKGYILQEIKALANIKERESRAVQDRVERIDAMRETPPQVGEYLLFHHTNTEEPHLVYVEHVYPNNENAHVRELGSRIVHNVGWQYLERPERLPHDLVYDNQCYILEYTRPKPNGDNEFSPRRRITISMDGQRTYLCISDTLEQLKVFHTMLSEFIILQERQIEQKKREVPNVSPATAAYLAKHPTAKLIEEGYINVILPPQED